MTIFDNFHYLTILTKTSILGVADVLNPTLITDIFASQSWTLISLNSIFPLFRNRFINFNGKEDGSFLFRLEYIDFK